MFQIDSVKVDARNSRFRQEFQVSYYPLVMTFTVRHGKIHHAFKNGVYHLFLGAIYTIAMLNNQMVFLVSWIIDQLFPYFLVWFKSPDFPIGWVVTCMNHHSRRVVVWDNSKGIQRVSVPTISIRSNYCIWYQYYQILIPNELYKYSNLHIITQHKPPLGLSENRLPPNPTSGWKSSFSLPQRVLLDPFRSFTMKYLMYHHYHHLSSFSITPNISRWKNRWTWSSCRMASTAERISAWITSVDMGYDVRSIIHTLRTKTRRNLRVWKIPELFWQNPGYFNPFWKYGLGTG